MLIKDFLPHVTLKNFIQCYRIVHFEFASGENIPVKVYPPKPEHCLHLFLRDFFAIEQNSQIVVQPTAILTGFRTQSVKQFTGNNFLNVQIVFQPTALHLLTGINQYELSNQHVDAHTVFPGKIDSLINKLQQTTSYTDMIIELDRFSTHLIANTKKREIPLDAACLEIMHHKQQLPSLEQWASAACLSVKQFTRKFNERTGVNPKTFLRITRFNKAYNCKNRFPDIEWSALAAKCGYVDYQHLSKDYKDFTGVTAFEFHRLESNSPERVLNIFKALYLSRYNNFC